MSARPWRATHTVLPRDANPYDVMLDEGAGYTKAEWDNFVNSDLEYRADGAWLLLGAPFEGRVERKTRAWISCVIYGDSKEVDYEVVWRGQGDVMFCPREVAIVCAPGDPDVEHLLYRDDRETWQSAAGLCVRDVYPHAGYPEVDDLRVRKALYLA